MNGYGGQIETLGDKVKENKEKEDDKGEEENAYRPQRQSVRI